MSGRDRGRRRGRILSLLFVLILVAAGAVAEVQTRLGRDWLDRQLEAAPAVVPPGQAGQSGPAPAEVPPPPGLSVAPLAVAGPVAEPGDVEVDPVAKRVRRALAPYLSDKDLGRHVRVAVAGLAPDSPVVDFGEGPPGGNRVIPASTTKLITSLAALSALGPDHTFATRSFVTTKRGTAATVTVVGGGDPYLASTPAAAAGRGYPARADITSLARVSAERLRDQGVRKVRVGYDESLFVGPKASPQWEADYLPDQVVAPISALWVDGGRPESGFGRVGGPASYAAGVFADALRAEGLKVTGAVESRKVPTDATELSSVTSAPLSRIVEHVLDVSDNEAAEVLAHQVGLKVTGEGSFSGGREGVAQTLAGLGISLEGDKVYDGSGLSRQSRVRPETLVAVLRTGASADHPELRAVVSGLPVAGFTGSLSSRFATGDEAGRGLVRAKTGTLTGVSGLAGLATDADGETLVFVAVADRVAVADTLDAREALDRLAAALAECDCARP